MSRNDRDDRAGHDADAPEEAARREADPAVDLRRPWRGGPRQWRKLAEQEIDRQQPEEHHDPLGKLSGEALYEFLRASAEKNRPRAVPTHSSSLRAGRLEPAPPLPAGPAQLEPETPARRGEPPTLVSSSPPAPERTSRTWRHDQDTLDTFEEARRLLEALEAEAQPLEARRSPEAPSDQAARAPEAQGPARRSPEAAPDQAPRAPESTSDPEDARRAPESLTGSDGIDLEPGDRDAVEPEPGESDQAPAGPSRQAAEPALSSAARTPEPIVSRGAESAPAVRRPRRRRRVLDSWDAPSEAEIDEDDGLEPEEEELAADEREELEAWKSSGSLEVEDAASHSLMEVLVGYGLVPRPEPPVAKEIKPAAKRPSDPMPAARPEPAPSSGAEVSQAKGTPPLPVSQPAVTAPTAARPAVTGAAVEAAPEAPIEPAAGTATEVAVEAAVDHSAGAAIASSLEPLPEALEPPSEPDPAAVTEALLQDVELELETEPPIRYDADEPLPGWMEPFGYVIDVDRLDEQARAGNVLEGIPTGVQTFWQTALAGLESGTLDGSGFIPTAERADAVVLAAGAPGPAVVERTVRQKKNPLDLERSEEWEIDSLLSSAIEAEQSEPLTPEMRAALRAVLEQDLGGEALTRELQIPPAPRDLRPPVAAGELADPLFGEPLFVRPGVTAGEITYEEGSEMSPVPTLEGDEDPEMVFEVGEGADTLFVDQEFAGGFAAGLADREAAADFGPRDSGGFADGQFADAGEEAGAGRASSPDPDDPLAAVLGQLEQSAGGLVVEEAGFDMSVVDDQNVQIQETIEEIESDEPDEDDPLSSVLGDLEGNAQAYSRVPEGWEHELVNDDIQVNATEQDSWQDGRGVRGMAASASYDPGFEEALASGLVVAQEERNERWDEGPSSEPISALGGNPGDWDEGPSSEPISALRGRPANEATRPGDPRSWDGGRGRPPEDARGWERGPGRPPVDDRERGRGRPAEDDRERGRGRAAEDDRERGRGRPPEDDRERGRGRPPEDDWERGRPPQDARDWERGRGRPPEDDWERGRPPQDARDWERGRGRPPEDDWERARPPQDARDWERGRGRPPEDDWERGRPPQDARDPGRGRGYGPPGSPPPIPGPYSDRPWWLAEALAGEGGEPGPRDPRGADRRPPPRAPVRDPYAIPDAAEWARAPRSGPLDPDFDPYRQGPPAGRREPPRDRMSRTPELDPWVTDRPRPLGEEAAGAPRGDRNKRLFDWPESVEQAGDLWNGAPQSAPWPDAWGGRGGQRGPAAPGRRVSDRRAFPRLIVSGVVYFRRQGRIATGELGDISRAGALVLTRTPLPPGSEIPLAMELPGSSRPLRMLGRVLYVRRLEALDSGYDVGAMGVVFEEMELEDRRALAGFLDQFGW